MPYDAFIFVEGSVRGIVVRVQLSGISRQSSVVSFQSSVFSRDLLIGHWGFHFEIEKKPSKRFGQEQI
jgi:hypothetical protein